VLEDPQLWRLPTSDIFRKTVTAISASMSWKCDSQALAEWARHVVCPVQEFESKEMRTRGTTCLVFFIKVM
jgi:hypothetical protein